MIEDAALRAAWIRLGRTPEESSFGRAGPVDLCQRSDQTGNNSDRCGAGTRKEDAVKLSPEPHEPDEPHLRGEQPTNAGPDDSEIDRILADSFPASDAPPWTLGVAQVPAKNSGTKTKNRGNR
jgi:hypothetical protein